MLQKKKDRGQKVVSNMGLFWKQDQVCWKGNRRIGKPRLAGIRRSAKKRGEVDFWKQTGIYALYRDYHLVYVGQAGLSDQSNLGNRLKHHLTDDLEGRWDMFSWFGLQKVRASDNKVGKRTKWTGGTRAHLANVLEGIIIEVADPPMNSQKGRFGSRVERYIQVDDSVDSGDAENKILQSIDKLDKKVEKTKEQLKRAIKKVSK